MTSSANVITASPKTIPAVDARSTWRRFSALTTLAATLMTTTTSGYSFAQTSGSGNPAPATSDSTTSAQVDATGAAATPSDAPLPDPVVKCVESYTEGQRLRNDGHLLEGRAQFWECSQSTCPAALRKDCITWSEELKAQIPTVSFRATLDGKLASDAKVYLDGRLLETALGGRAVELNPGPHTARFELGSFPAQEQEFVAAEGERYRVLNAEFKSLTPAPVAVNTSPTPLVDTAPERPIPTLTYVFLGVGVAGAISAVVWGISTSVTKGDLEATCSPNCSQNKIDAVKQRALLSDISTGVGILGFAGAAITYFTRPEAPRVGSVELDAVNLGSHGALGLVRVHTN